MLEYLGFAPFRIDDTADRPTSQKKYNPTKTLFLILANQKGCVSNRVNLNFSFYYYIYIFTGDNIQKIHR